MDTRWTKLAWVVVFALCFTACSMIFAQWFTDTASANTSEGQPAVAPVTVAARNPVEGLRELAREKGDSYQVFLWRAAHYLDGQFKDASFEAIQKMLEEAGAVKTDDWGDPESPGGQVRRYAVVQDIIKNREKWAHTFMIELSQYGKSPPPQVRGYLLVKFGLPFKTVAERRDYPKGTVLDRVLGLADLEEQAKETTQLDSIEIYWGGVGSIGGALGWGFRLNVEMSDPTGHSRLKWQKICYMVCSGLEPLHDGLYGRPERKPEIHVARDVLIPGVSPWSLQEHCYPGVFISAGGESVSR